MCNRGCVFGSKEVKTWVAQDNNKDNIHRNEISASHHLLPGACHRQSSNTKMDETPKKGSDPLLQQGTLDNN